MVYLFLADGFEIVEAMAPADFLTRAGAKVVTVGVTGKTAVSSCGIPVVSDIEVSEIKLDNSLEMIILPGGMPGTKNLESDKTVQSAIDYCVDKGLLVGAICAAPSILGHKGLLKGRKATCFPSFESELEGAELTGQQAVRDGQFITGKGAGAALDFGYELVKALFDKDTADAVAAKMQCR